MRRLPPLLLTAFAVTALAPAAALAQAPTTAQPPALPPGLEVHRGAEGLGAFSCDLHCRLRMRRDVTGDGRPDRITADDTGGLPHVTVVDGRTEHTIDVVEPFHAGYRGHGGEIAVGDVDGDGTDDIVIAAGPGAAPQVRVFHGDGRRVSSFFAYDPSFRGGVHVAAGDLDGDGTADIVVGAGPGGGPNVRVFSESGELRSDFFAGDPSFRGGVWVAVREVDVSRRGGSRLNVA